MNDRASHPPRTGRSLEAFRTALEDNLYFARGSTLDNASLLDLYMALAFTVRDHLVERWRRTSDAWVERDGKLVYYLSAEFLLGKQLSQNLFYTELTDVARETVEGYGIELAQLLALEPEPGLGNGGLGRLAACYLDSLATLGVLAVGYGLRYEFGIFRQSIVEGWQVERPDEWLHQGNPWEFRQGDEMVEVGFGGHTEHVTDDEGRHRVRWVSETRVLGEPYLTLVPGYGITNVNVLRLWRARASEEFDFQCFDVGDYTRAVEKKVESENLTKVLYPNDRTPQGKSLRLKQQYFFVACSLRDILRRFRRRHDDWRELPDKAVIQLNDTHPVLAIPELMRILMDEELLGWDEAWAITQRTFAYTCHTLLPEALERWPLSLFGSLLPRHLEIVFEINRRFLDAARGRFPDDAGRIARLSLIEEGQEKKVRMAHLATVGSFAVNGVAPLQSRLLRERTLADLSDVFPEKFTNKTNGVTPRRFLALANPRLARLVTDTIGDGWLRDLEKLGELEAHVEDPVFREAWRAVKRANKEDLARLVRERQGVEVDPASLFDVMVKRLHEYKRQLLKALHVVTLYHRIKEGRRDESLPRTVMFGAKAAPGYQMAKLVIKLINDLAGLVNRDPDVSPHLAVVFLADFNVTLAEKVVPAADLSQQISMAGKEASGTGNMKFALNGAVTSGTLDGANIEIRERVGAENFFLFGLDAETALELQTNGYRPRDLYERNPELRRALDTIASLSGERSLFHPILDALLGPDTYLVLADYPSYVESQQRAAAAFADPEAWTRMSILNVARCGYFSSDRSIREYSRDIWKVEPVEAS